MQNGATDVEIQGGAIRLPAALDLAAADGFLKSMQQHARGQMPLRIDASGVQVLTLPCVQIMLAAARDQGPISVESPSPAFLGAFEELGIEWATILNCVEGDFQEQINSNSDDANAFAVDMPGASDEAESSIYDAQPISERTMTKRIMTIDDSKTMRDMLMLTLTEAGFDVLQAVDGQDGLDKLSTEQVDVVITDINMPKMDGYEVVRRLRGDPAYRSTPILVLTTESDVEKRDTARMAGATGWMVKPFDPDRLVEAVRKVAR